MDTDREVYIILLQGGLTPEGVCGSMGNMAAESSMKANIAQRGMTTLSDEQYTLAVDMGTISAYDFAHDGVGYGLCQWTYPPRKANLLKYAKECGVSVGDAKMQAHFFLKELTEDYPQVYKVLSTSHNLKECSDLVCTDFERPAYNNLEARFQFALDFYEKYGSMNPPNAPIMPDLNNAFNIVTPDIPSPNVQMPNDNSGFSFGNFMSGLWDNVTGGKSSTVSAKMPILKLGDQGAGVAAVQVALKYHKVNIGDTGTLGVWEAGTTMGIKTFQQQHNIKPSGEMDSATWEALFK